MHYILHAWSWHFTHCLDSCTPPPPFNIPSAPFFLPNFLSNWSAQVVRRTGQVWHQKVHFEVRKRYTCDALLSALASGILLHFAATLSSTSEHKKYITRPPHIDHIITSHIRHNQLLSCFTCSIAVAFLERERKQNYFSQGGVSLFITLETHQTSKPLKDHESDTSGLTLPTHSYSSIAFHAKMSYNIIRVAKLSSRQLPATKSTTNCTRKVNLVRTLLVGCGNGQRRQ